jgi:parvulin-like peptidyl-prolyl isomerase
MKRTRRAARLLVLLVCLALAAACGGRGPRERSGKSSALAHGIVANVDGTPISVGEVQALCERGGLTPKLALERLEAEALLAAEAERRGYASIDPVEQVGRQALVQALLAEDVESQTPSAADLDAAYAKNLARFRRPELRTATHVLASLPKQPTPEQDAAARAFVQDVILKLKAAADPNPVLEAIQRSTDPNLPVRVEVLPPAPREGMFVPEFTAALFSLEKPGIVPQPVRTPFGWHAIWLREILPEERVPESVARAQLTRELELELRQKRLEVLLRQLQERAGVKYAPKVRDALAVLEY